MEKVEIKKTITNIFCVPTLHVPKGRLKDNGFLNAYIKDDMRDVVHEDSIYLLFKVKDVDRFREFLESEYERTKSIIEDYDHSNGFVVVVYKLNVTFASDFALVRQGMYSKTSKEFKEEFPKTVTLIIDGVQREEISLQYRIFNKTEDLTKFWEEKFNVEFDDSQEIWRGFQEDEETLTEEKLKEYEQQ